MPHAHPLPAASAASVAQAHIFQQGFGQHFRLVVQLKKAPADLHLSPHTPDAHLTMQRATQLLTGLLAFVHKMDMMAVISFTQKGTLRRLQGLMFLPWPAHAAAHDYSTLQNTALDIHDRCLKLASALRGRLGITAKHKVSSQLCSAERSHIHAHEHTGASPIVDPHSSRHTSCRHPFLAAWACCSVLPPRTNCAAPLPVAVTIPSEFPVHSLHTHSSPSHHVCLYSRLPFLSPLVRTLLTAPAMRHAASCPCILPHPSLRRATSVPVSCHMGVLQRAAALHQPLRSSWAAPTSPHWPFPWPCAQAQLLDHYFLRLWVDMDALLDNVNAVVWEVLGRSGDYVSSSEGLHFLESTLRSLMCCHRLVCTVQAADGVGSADAGGWLAKADRIELADKVGLADTDGWLAVLGELGCGRRRGRWIACGIRAGGWLAV